MTEKETDDVMGQLAAEVIAAQYDPVVFVVRVLYCLTEYVTPEQFRDAVEAARQVPFVRSRDRKPH